MMSEKINPDDLEISFYQNQEITNRPSTSARIVHIPTGIVVRSQEKCSKQENLNMAIGLLRNKLIEREKDFPMPRWCGPTLPRIEYKLDCLSRGELSKIHEKLKLTMNFPPRKLREVG